MRNQGRFFTSIGRGTHEQILFLTNPPPNFYAKRQIKVSIKVYECLDQTRHISENLTHEKHRHWDIREFDEYIVNVECRLPCQERQRNTFAVKIYGTQAAFTFWKAVSIHSARFLSTHWMAALRLPSTPPIVSSLYHLS